MAERRMFAKTIIDSDAFLDMPISARLLYYDLAMRADDDGFVNAPKKIMRIVGASIDDINLLAVRKFIIPFDSGIVVIKHWRIHNYIRKDTYNETKYKEEKSTLLLDENDAYTTNIEIRDETVTKPSRTVDEPLTQVRLGKDRIGNIYTSSDKSDTVKQNSLDYSAIIAMFNEACSSLPSVRSITDKRRKAIKTAAGAIEQLGGFEKLFRTVEQSDFLSGRSGQWNGCGFDWIIKPANAVKIFEGNYANKRIAAASEPDLTDTSRYSGGWE